jgi:RHS repeat-associated protein
LLDETLNIDNLNLKVSYSYDANDYLSDMSYPDPKSEKLFYFPDNLGRPTKVHPLASIDAYYPNGNLKDFYYANDIQTHNTLDNRQRPESTIITAHFLTSNKSVIYNTKNLYEPNNNIKSITDLTGSSIYDRQFTYDNLDRLSGINLFGALDTNITYNANGDIVKNNTTNNLDYTYNVNHQLSSISGTKNYSFTYDHWGNITNNGRNSFAYNDAQNLRCIDCNTSTATTYLYDTNHYRVKSKKNNISTYYFYNKDGLLLLEYTPAKSTAKQFAYIGNKLIAMRRVYSSTLDLDLDGIADAKEINESATSITNGEDLTYYHSDANGSIIGAANHPAGNTIFTESYAPYGEQFFNTINPLLKNPSSIWFAGKQRDESGLLYFGARYYDPEIGRFMSIDPISTDPLNIHSFNRYAYANNNPYKFTDPDGRDPIKMIFTPITNIGDNPAVQGYFQDIYSQNKKNYDFPGINKTVTAHIGTLDEVVADAKKSYGFNIKKEDYSLNSDTPAGALAINPYNIYIISDQINFNLTRWSGSILGHELVHTNQFEKGTLPLLSEPGNPLKSAQAEIEAYTWQLQTVKKFGLTQLSIDTIQSGINANLAVEARLEH